MNLDIQIMELVINDWFRQYYDILYYQQSRPIVRNMLIAEFGKLTSHFPTILVGKGEFHVFSSETSLLTDVNCEFHEKFPSFISKWFRNDYESFTFPFQYHRKTEWTVWLLINRWKWISKTSDWWRFEKLLECHFGSA